MRGREPWTLRVARASARAADRASQTASTQTLKEIIRDLWRDLDLPVNRGINPLLKRSTDLALALLALPVAFVPMLVIAALVKVSSSGPVFYRARRNGLNGEEIIVRKFRTMSVCEEGDAVRQVTKGDPRVTRLGRILRKLSLDELPQLLNVLEGSMSLVGPRPHSLPITKRYSTEIPGYWARHAVTPGITGLAAVNGWRGDADELDKMQGRVHDDIEYIRRWSLWLDFRILVRTVIAAFHGS